MLYFEWNYLNYLVPDPISADWWPHRQECCIYVLVVELIRPLWWMIDRITLQHPTPDNQLVVIYENEETNYEQL